MLSVVIPVYNEAESLETLHRELDEAAKTQGYEVELIFVDDGSKDASWEQIQRLAAADGRVRGLRFRRNFGKAAALAAGFAEVRGELVMTLDADLQDDPQEIPRFLAEVHRGLDVVSGYKQVRHDPWHKVFPSRVFNWMVSRLTGVALHDHNCGMKCYRREVLGELVLYGELHRFVPVLAAARGFRVGELVVGHRPRRFGRSKYGLSRFVKGFLDLLSVKFVTGYGQRPQHVLGSAGLGSILLGLLGLIATLAAWRTGHADGASLTMIGSTGLLVFGGLLLAIGLVAELLVASWRQEMRNYSIAARTSSSAAVTDPPGVAAGASPPPAVSA
jgi:glycosyltransferase involved in cell wall biosynthesis